MLKRFDITSPQNTRFKAWRSWLEQPKLARRAQKMLIEGVHLCSAYLSLNDQSTHLVHQGVQFALPNAMITTEEGLTSSVIQAQIASVMTRVETLSQQGSVNLPEVSLIVLSTALFKQLSDVVHGVALLFEIDLPEQILPEQINESVVVLDGVQDPGNVGTILRTAAAAGIKHVYTTPNSALVWSAKVLRAAMGAHFVINVCEGVSIDAFLSVCQLPRYATMPHVKDSIYTQNLTAPCVWVFGHEGEGVSAAWQVGTTPLTIPQIAEVESLNVAAAAAVCLFEQRRQCLLAHS